MGPISLHTIGNGLQLADNDVTERADDITAREGSVSTSIF